MFRHTSRLQFESKPAPARPGIRAQAAGADRWRLRRDDRDHAVPVSGLELPDARQVQGPDHPVLLASKIAVIELGRFKALVARKRENAVTEENGLDLSLRYLYKCRSKAILYFLFIMSKLLGKVAVVTGASKGIGAGIAKALAAEGASVVVNYSTSKEGADRVVDEISKRNGRAVAIHGDVAKAADLERIFAETKRAFGQLDVLVNNAGVYEFAPARSGHRRAISSSV